jgi:uncharacterized protein (DUF2249 family)
MHTHHHQAADDPLQWPATLLDVGGLEAPDPMIRILDALATLSEQGCLHVLIDREPHPLYGILERHAFRHRCAPTGDGRYELLVWQLPLPNVA